MINLGLARISSLLQPLFSNHTPLPWRAIHIAGTNGKGSIASYISTLLSHQGYKVGRFTSPHLVHRWDCISLNQRPVDKDVFLKVESEVQRRSRDQGIDATEFEVLTAVAFELFTRHGMEFGIVECGLGGRLDSTNALRQQDVELSVLAKVGLDHVDFLGDTIQKIAEEKTGIFKTGVPIVVDETNDPCVLDVVKHKLKEINGDDNDPDRFFVHLPAQLKSALNDTPAIQAMALADHQRQNLTTALTAYYALKCWRSKSEQAKEETTTSHQPTGEQQTLRVIQTLPDLIRQAHASLRGRLETLTLPPHLIPPPLPSSDKKQEPQPVQIQVLLDGAHNPQSATALAAHLQEHVRTKHNLPILWVLSMKGDKDISTVIKTLVAPGDFVITCAFGPVDGMPWVSSLDAQDLADEVTRVTTPSMMHGGEDVHVKVASDVKGPASVAHAIRLAVEVAGSSTTTTSSFGSSSSVGQATAGHRPICIAGSLYLVGDVFQCLEDPKC